MRLRRALVTSSSLVTMSLLLGMAILFACSTDDAAPIGDVPADSSTDRAMRKESSPEEDDASGDAAPLCSPHALTEQPMWHAPKPINPSACTRTQVADFLTACLTGTRAACDGFRQQNAACAACAYTSDDDSSWGPLISYRDKSYAQVNLGGCIAVSAGEPDGTGCGGSYQLYDQCALEACSGCLPINTKNTVAKLGTCQDDPQIKQTCATWIAQGKTACAPLSASGPAKRCALGTNSFQENARRYVAFWCSTPGDPDAGDAGDARDTGDASDGS
jgi:hypothetical protein